MPARLRRPYRLISGDVPLVLLTALLGLRRGIAIFRCGVQDLTESARPRGCRTSLPRCCTPVLLRKQLIARAGSRWGFAGRSLLGTGHTTTGTSRFGQLWLLSL